MQMRAAAQTRIDKAAIEYQSNSTAAIKVLNENKAMYGKKTIKYLPKTLFLFMMFSPLCCKYRIKR